MAIPLLENGIVNDKKFIIMCKGFVTDDDDDNFVEVTSDDIDEIKANPNYQLFEIFER